MSCRQPGRFNTSRFGAVYVSGDPATAFAEFEQSADTQEIGQCSIFRIHAELESVVDLTEAACRADCGITLDELWDDDLTRCQALAARLSDAGAEAVRWPSARGHGENVAIYVANLSPGSRIDIIAAHALTSELVSEMRQTVTRRAAAR
jgi:RES domain-containing protein